MYVYIFEFNFCLYEMFPYINIRVIMALWVYSVCYFFCSICSVACVFDS